MLSDTSDALRLLPCGSRSWPVTCVCDGSGGDAKLNVEEVLDLRCVRLVEQRGARVLDDARDDVVVTRASGGVI